jgi:hypothetical protein
MNGQNFELEQIILIYACLQNMCDNHILYQFNIYIYIYSKIILFIVNYHLFFLRRL